MIRVGECNQCGQCCEHPTPERIVAYEESGWDYTNLGECPLDAIVRVDGKIICGDYENRPQMCRDFPQHPLDIVALPECGYSFKE